MDTLALTDRDGALRRGEVRPGRPVGRDPRRCSASTSPSSPPGCSPPAVDGPTRRGGPARAASGRAAAAGAPARGATGRPAAPAGHRAGPRTGRLGGAVPAGLGHPPARRARAAGEHRRPGRRARRGPRPPPVAACSCCSVPGPRSAGRCPPAAPTSPAPCWRRWRERCSTRPTCCVEVVSPPRAGRRPAARHAARMLGLAARGSGVPAVLTNAVRYADRVRRPDGRRARRGPPAGRRSTPRHVDRVNAEGYLKSRQGDGRGRRGGRLGRRAGRRGAARRLLAATRRAGRRGAPSTRAPTSGSARCTSPSSRCSDRPAPQPRRRRPTAQVLLRQRCEAGLGRRGDGRHPGAGPRERLDDELGDHRRARLRRLLPHRRRRRRPHPRHGGAGRGPRLGGRAAWSTTCSASPASTRSATGC